MWFVCTDQLKMGTKRFYLLNNDKITVRKKKRVGVIYINRERERETEIGWVYERDLFYIKKCKQNKKKKLFNDPITIFFHDHELVHTKFYEKYVFTIALYCYYLLLLFSLYSCYIILLISSLILSHSLL